MITLTDALERVPDLDRVFRDAVSAPKPSDAYSVWASVRARHGFAPIPSPLLTPPAANLKLEKGSVPSYGLTLQHYVTALPASPGNRRLVVNACPHAGDCVRVCVLNNGNGRYDAVQRARRAKLDLFTRHPETAVRILAFELAQAVRKHGAILFRPNVNSDVAWERILPSLTSGDVFGPAVLSYGYSKVPDVLDTDGWLGAQYRVAYSWNEHSNARKVRAFLMRGGSVAVVTDRGKGQPVTAVFPFGTTAGAVDADLTDEWMFASGVVGDLSAKGKARQLIGRSGFVVSRRVA